MTVTAQAVPILSDNYAWLLREDGSGAVAIVDPAEGPPIIAAIEAAGVGGPAVAGGGARPYKRAPRRGARVADRGGLENRCACKRTVGSNPTLSATPL